MTPLTVGSPAEVIEKTLTFREYFGDYQRQLFLMDHAGLPLKTVLEQLDLLGEEVVPVLRRSSTRCGPPTCRTRPPTRACARPPSWAALAVDRPGAVTRHDAPAPIAVVSAGLASRRRPGCSPTGWPRRPAGGRAPAASRSSWSASSCGSWRRTSPTTC